MSNSDPLLEFREQFPILGQTNYLVSNSLGAMPRGVSKPQITFLSPTVTCGIVGAAPFPLDEYRQVNALREPIRDAVLDEVRVRPDGGIHKSNLVTYNTAISMTALGAASKPEYHAIIRNARSFLIGLQRDFGEKGKLDDVYDGGIGYGSKYTHSDMGNTLAALEALYYSKQFAADKDSGRDLNWAAAIQFLQNCQKPPVDQFDEFPEFSARHVVVGCPLLGHDVTLSPT